MQIPWYCSAAATGIAGRRLQPRSGVAVQVLVGAQAFDDVLDALRLGLRHHQQGIVGVDDDEILHADEGDYLAVSAVDGAARAVDRQDESDPQAVRGAC